MHKRRNTPHAIFLFTLLALFLSSCSDKNYESKDEEKPIITEPDTLTTYGTLKSGKSSLVIKETKKTTYFPRIYMEGVESFYQQPTPIILEIVTNSNTYNITTEYDLVEIRSNTIFCSAIVTTTAGSKINIEDTYKTLDNNGLFELDREVTILEANSIDMGFASQISFKSEKPAPLIDYDFFVPGVWYKDNAYVSENSLAANYSDNNFWIREDRLPLPFIMTRSKASGITFSIAHKDPKGDTFKEEDGLKRLIDKRLKFASIGLENNQHPTIGLIYPGSEGDRTYIYGAKGKNWAYRSHPVEKGFQQKYKASFKLSKETDYASALKNTWLLYYKLFDPLVYPCNMKDVYDLNISVLSQYWKSINGVSGLPFRVMLNGQVEQESDYNFNMGFVGQQPGNASLLIREGLKTKNNALLTKGEQMADFWATEAMTDNGCPKTWYDPYPQTWRGPEVALREIGDGMIGLLRAWNYEKKYQRNKPIWLASCIKVADWIVSVQLSNGALHSHYNYNTGGSTKNHTNCTSHIIPFLVEMYLATADIKYKNAALNAGNFIIDDLLNNYKYVGGAIDNPNVMDKEAASMALRAFLALYDINANQKWMDGIQQTIYFYQSWIICWNIPIPSDDSKAVFPPHRSVVGQSIIATGHSAADSYAAIDAFSFYRAYLYLGDEQLLHFSKLLFYNTKQFMNWNLTNDPIGWIAPGLLGEAMSVCVPRGHGVNYYLPWSTYNQMEPLVLLEDAFGNIDISIIEKLLKKEQTDKNIAYSLNRLY